MHWVLLLWMAAHPGEEHALIPVGLYDTKAQCVNAGQKQEQARHWRCEPWPRKPTPSG